MACGLQLRDNHESMSGPSSRVARGDCAGGALEHGDLKGAVIDDRHRAADLRPRQAAAVSVSDMDASKPHLVILSGGRSLQSRCTDGSMSKAHQSPSADRCLHFVQTTTWCTISRGFWCSGVGYMRACKLAGWRGIPAQLGIRSQLTLNAHYG